MNEQNDCQEENWKDFLKKAGEEIKTNAELLKQRYKDCDDDKHKEFIDGYCIHCYRRMNYTTPKTDKEQEFRRKLRGPVDIFHQPMDAPVWMGKREEEIASQKDQDWFYGLRKIAEERVIQEAQENTDSIDDKLSEEN